MRRLSFLALLFPLYGCSTPDPTILAVSCPVSAVLAQAAFVTKVRPGGNNPANVVLTANMSLGQLGCDYDPEDNRVRVDLTLPISVMWGPAGANSGAQTLS